MPALWLAGRRHTGQRLFLELILHSFTRLHYTSCCKHPPSPIPSPLHPYTADYTQGTKQEGARGTGAQGRAQLPCLAELPGPAMGRRRDRSPLLLVSHWQPFPFLSPPLPAESLHTCSPLVRNASRGGERPSQLRPCLTLTTAPSSLQAEGASVYLTL